MSMIDPEGCRMQVTGCKKAAFGHSSALPPLFFRCRGQHTVRLGCAGADRAQVADSRGEQILEGAAARHADQNPSHADGDGGPDLE